MGSLGLEFLVGGRVGLRLSGVGGSGTTAGTTTEMLFPVEPVGAIVLGVVGKVVAV